MIYCQQTGTLGYQLTPTVINSYIAGANGSITGASPQTVQMFHCRQKLTAVPDANYHFVNWSDASIANPRAETNVNVMIQ